MSCPPGCARPTPAQAHCPTCHATFGGVTAFDRHRRDGRCVDPRALGMVRRDGVWRQPMDPRKLARLRAL